MFDAAAPGSSITMWYFSGMARAAWVIPLEYGPTSRSTWSCEINFSYSSTAVPGLLWSSYTTSCTGRPSHPPRLLSCETNSLYPFSWYSPVAANGPVSEIERPTLIGFALEPFQAVGPNTSRCTDAERMSAVVAPTAPVQTSATEAVTSAAMV